jgi:predicted porin
MKKTLIALAALSAAAGAMAQSTVTLYGALDVGVAYGKNVNATGKSNTYLNDSAIQSSLWGLKGSEDLGNGLKANFNLQGDVAMDTGALPRSGEIFRREANVSLVSADIGEVRLGRTLSPAYVASLGNQIIPQNSIGVSTALAMGYGGDIFTKNAVTYISPNMSGITGTFQYSFGERIDGTGTNPASGAGTGPNDANRKVAGSVLYVAGPLKAVLGGENVEGRDGKTSRRWYVANAQYSIGDFRLAGGLAWLHKGASALSADADTVQVPVSSHNVSLGVGYQFNQQALLTATYVSNNRKSSLFNITGRYALSKRTALYGLAAIADNDKSGAVNFTPLFSNISGVTNKKQGAIQAGVIHAF